jgi:hypothetical protein
VQEVVTNSNAPINNNVGDFNESEEQTQSLQQLNAHSTRFLGPRPLPGITIKQSFAEDVKDNIWLSWIGQIYDSHKNDNNYTSLPEDKTYNPYADDFENYSANAMDFVDVRNKEEADFIKGKIDRNNARRERIADSGRILPAFVAAFADPITYVPIPFASGVGFVHKAVKGGLLTGAAVGATEPIRHAYDPTATFEETAGYVGFGMLAGGLLSGVFGKKLQLNGKPATKQTIMENASKAFHKSEGRVDFENIKVPNDVFINIKAGQPNLKLKDVVKGSVSNVKNRSSKFISELDLQTKRIGEKTRKRKWLNYDAKEEIMYIDLAQGYRLAQTGRGFQPQGKGRTPLPRSIIKNTDDFIKFNIKKELLKAQAPKTSKLQRQNDELLVDYENRIDQVVLQDIIRENQADRSIKAGAFLSNVDSWGNLGNLVNRTAKRIKNAPPSLIKYIQTRALNLSGDFSTSQRAIDLGIAGDSSVVMRNATEDAADLLEVLDGIKQDYMQLRGIDPTTGAVQQFIGKGALFGEKVVNTVRKNILRQKLGDEPAKLTDREYFQQLGKLRIQPELIEQFQLDATVQNIYKRSIARLDKYFKKKLTDGKNAEMFASQGSFTKFQLNKRQNRLNAESIDTSKLNAESKQMLQEKITRLKKEENKFAKQASNFKDKKPDEDFLPRVWLIDKIRHNSDQFKTILRKHIQNKMNTKIKSIPNNLSDKELEQYLADKGFVKSIDAEVEAIYKKIVDNEATMQDGEGIGGFAKDIDGRFKVGAKNLLQRELDIPNADVSDFIELDTEFLLRSYHARMAPAIRLAEEFGDTHMVQFLDDLEIKLIKENTPKNEINTIINGFRDEKDKVLGILNTQDPTSFGARTAKTLRNWASVAMMGRVIFSALVDVARPVMVHGFEQSYKVAIKPWLQNLDVYSRAVKDINYLAPIMEMSLDTAAYRELAESGVQGGNRLGDTFGRFIEQPLERAQGPFFMLNGLTPWTHLMKRFQTNIAMHRFIEDSIKWNKGTLDSFGQERLLSYGIDKRTAEVIANMPVEKVDDVAYVANAQEWTGAGADNARRKLSNAIWSDTQRTIVTPTPADKFNMMTGVIRINNEEYANLLDNNFFRMLGYTKTDMGGKFSNAYMGLPFQFFSWGIAANRKVLTSMVQGRERAVMSGITAAISMGMLGDYLKNPSFYGQKDFEEKVIRGVELSGVLGLFGDLNFIAETLSGGLFNKPIGLRPLLGQEGRFGDPDAISALGEIVGAGPSMIADLLYAFGTGNLTYNEKATLIRRMIPFNSLFYIDESFRNMYNDAILR